MSFWRQPITSVSFCNAGYVAASGWDLCTGRGKHAWRAKNDDGLNASGLTSRRLESGCRSPAASMRSRSPRSSPSRAQPLSRCGAEGPPRLWTRCRLRSFLRLLSGFYGFWRKRAFFRLCADEDHPYPKEMQISDDIDAYLRAYAAGVLNFISSRHIMIYALVLFIFVFRQGHKRQTAEINGHYGDLSFIRERSLRALSGLRRPVLRVSGVFAFSQFDRFAVL
jgi:hypothetical protein